MKITVRVRSREALAALRESRRAVRGDMAAIIARHGRHKVLPAARRLSPSIVRDSLTIRPTRSGARLTTTARGVRRRTLGYLNFGGTIRKEIRPRKAKALRMKDGRFVARVKRPRTFAGLHFMEEARDRHLAALRRELQRELPRIVQRRIDGITRTR